MQDTTGSTARLRAAGATATDDAHRPGVQSIARAGRVLRALEQAPDGLPLVELAAAVTLPKSTVHRLVGALADEGLAPRPAAT
jgi:DNA-binding IclR family transcriptional regulator